MFGIELNKRQSHGGQKHRYFVRRFQGKISVWKIVLLRQKTGTEFRLSRTRSIILLKLFTNYTTSLKEKELSGKRDANIWLWPATKSQRISQILHAAMELRDSGDPEDTDVPELLRSVLNFYKSRFDSQDIAVNTRYRSGAHLSAYPHQLRQMCANLLLNAADAMPSGGKIYARIAPAHEWKGDTQARIAAYFR